MWTLEKMTTDGADWLDASGPDSDVVLSTRVRLARNIESSPFPDAASDDTLVAVREQILSSMAQSNYLKGAAVLRMEDTDPVTRRLMMERHITSPSFDDTGHGRAVLIGERELISAVINEEDHLRLQCIRSGLTPVDAWRLAERVDTELERNLHYAFDSDWGFLTACPTNVGTGLRVSVLAHLPGLSRTGGISSVLRSLSRLSLSVRGFYGEGSAAQGGFFQVSNQTTLGQSEEEITDTVERIARQLSNLEREARVELRRSEGARLEDDVWRAFGILANARVISAREVMGFSSALRLGVALDLVDWPDLATLNRLLILTQPGHLERSGAGPSEGRIDVARADLVRGILARAH